STPSVMQPTLDHSHSSAPRQHREASRHVTRIRREYSMVHIAADPRQATTKGAFQRKGRWWARISVVGTAIIMVLGLSVQYALAAGYTETGDAISLPPGQTPPGVAALTSITGSTNDVSGDFEDLYRICVTGDSFSATTVNGANFDTQLFLFADDGTGM